MTTPATSQGLLFGTVAESYERFRLGYPDQVVDRTLAYAGRTVEAAVEVGAGTGKATRAFTSRGVSVTALEPDPGMHGVLLRETAGMQVEPLLRSLEEYDGPRVGLVYAAAAWHWTDPATRYRDVAAMLTDGGVLAVFGAPMRVADEGVQTAIAAVTAATLDGPLDDPAFSPPSAVSWDTGPTWLDRELRETPLFTDVRLHVLPRVVVLPQRELVGYLSTLSAFLALPAEARQLLLARVVEVLPDQVAVDLTVGLHLARRA